MTQSNLNDAAVELHNSGLACAKSAYAANSEADPDDRVRFIITAYLRALPKNSDVERLKNNLAEAKKDFQFTCPFDERLATPDYAKYKSAYTAFRIAEQALAATQTEGE